MCDCFSKKSNDNPAILSDQDCDMDNGDENPERGNWTHKREYMLSLIGYAVGLGNIWRFPYVAYKNGGGAFLIPYFLLLVLCGIPLFFMENAIGQFCSQGPVNMWRAVPMLQGVGLSVVIGNILMSTYYNVIISYSMYYLFASFQSPLPWSSCFSWADSNCSSTPRVSCNVSGVLVANWTQENITCPSTDVITVPVQSPSEQYWDRVALQRSSGLDETGPIVWHLALCLLLTSILVAAALFKGIKSYGKVLYFTALFPYVVILILLIRGVTLEGAAEGIAYYIGSRSNFTKLTEPEVWKDAAIQTLYSLSIGMGGVTTLASYNNFHNNMLWDSVVATLTNHGTSVYAGFAIFSILGHMSYVYGKPVESVVTEGFSLVFIAYPDALAKLPISPLWSILFFSMLTLVGLDTQFTMIEVTSSCLIDAFPETLQSKHHFVSLGSCVFIFLLGLPCVTTAGIYWVTLIDHFATSWVLLILAYMEVLGFCYIYGVNNLIKDIEMMIGRKSFCFWLWWKAFWVLISPCLILVIFIWSLINFVPPTYGGVEYPDWGLALGWCMSAFILIWIPLVIGYRLMRAEGGLLGRLKSVCTPSEDWHPYLEIHRGERYSEESCRQRKPLSTKNKPI
ncbi:sodium- and chloride-dependent neutral and basic amino acid transporter B(0+)-like [Hippoglossus stenolepis]|uniref:sodium- and chloride-dependent neutral and basic amino acid transporter B(0+)-like n=1 Tax=Hippoglossus stenolepis TaxID=195615 RepID=UPI001FAF31CB|nr:sodium- and chloride-dependent neutral and basic amino acid transporter B(0+)-like [Hippoglossus stenolepis]